MANPRRSRAALPEATRAHVHRATILLVVAVVTLVTVAAGCQPGGPGGASASSNVQTPLPLDSGQHDTPPAPTSTPVPSA